MPFTIGNIAIAITANALLLSAVFAQQSPSSTKVPPAAYTEAAPQKEDPVSLRLDHLSRQLKLSTDQRFQIEPILRDEQNRIISISKDSSFTAEQKREQIEQIHETSLGLMQGVLTPEQSARLNAGDLRNARNLGWMSKNLNLTNDQKSRLRPVFETEQRQLRAARRDSSLSPEQKQAKIREIHASARAQVMSVLTPPQQQKMRLLMRNAARERGYGRGMGPDRQPAPTEPPR